MKRKMLAAREDLVDSVSALANRRGLTLFGVTNEALEQVLKVNELGCRLSARANHIVSVQISPCFCLDKQLEANAIKYAHTNARAAKC